MLHIMHSCLKTAGIRNIQWNLTAILEQHCRHCKKSSSYIHVDYTNANYIGQTKVRYISSNRTQSGGTGLLNINFSYNGPLRVHLIYACSFGERKAHTILSPGPTRSNLIGKVQWKSDQSSEKATSR